MGLAVTDLAPQVSDVAAVFSLHQPHGSIGAIIGRNGRMRPTGPSSHLTLYLFLFKRQLTTDVFPGLVFFGSVTLAWNLWISKLTVI